MSRAKPKELLEAIGELAMAIKPHSQDVRHRQRIAAAMSTLIDHIILYAKEAK